MNRAASLRSLVRKHAPTVEQVVRVTPGEALVNKHVDLQVGKYYERVLIIVLEALANKLRSVNHWNAQHF